MGHLWKIGAFGGGFGHGNDGGFGMLSGQVGDEGFGGFRESILISILVRKSTINI